MSEERRSPPESAEERSRRLEAVRRRLLDGELDSDAALEEAAFALLDGDRPPLTRR